jgi:hypothetical protein
MLQLLAVNHFGAGELITFLAALLRDPDREGQRVQAFVFSDVVRLAKQHAVDRHVVDEPGPVGEVSQSNAWFASPQTPTCASNLKRSHSIISAKERSIGW